MNILGLACEPWQTKILINTMASLDRKNSFRFHLGILDFYQYVHNVEYVNYNEFSLSKIEFYDQNVLYKSWQEEQEDNQFLEDFDLVKWESENCKDRSLTEIERGNALTNQWERESYWLPVTKYWEKRVLVDTIKWCEKLILEVKPQIVINIERAELAQSIINLICKRENIPMLTFIPSRVGNRWLCREDFGYGTSSVTQNQIFNAKNCAECLNKADDYINEFRNKPSESYSSIAGKERIDFNNPSKNLPRRLVKDLFELIKDIYYRHFIVPREMALKPVRFEEHHLKFTGVKTRKLMIKYLHLAGLNRWGHTEIPPRPYILWALHGRPETSVLVLGNGADEIQKIKQVASLIPSGYILVVKENPVMFGTRGRKFYRDLNRISNVYLLDAYVDTYEAVRRAVGIIGISGTILLEGAILAKPICILGNPEFISNFSYTGTDGLSNFINDIRNEKLVEESQIARQYLAYIFHYSMEKNVKYFWDPDSQESLEVTDCWATNVEEKIHNIKK